MKVKCDFCAKGPFINQFHAAAIHTKAFHDIILKIHEKIAVLENQDDGYDKMFLTEVQKLLKSLLENQK